jgi:hypothetical protein
MIGSFLLYGRLLLVIQAAAFTPTDKLDAQFNREQRPLSDVDGSRAWGAGEPSAAIVPAAISNAIFDAAGVRMRSVPFTPAKVKAALQGT